MTDACPVCGRGRLTPDWHNMTVSHLDCVRKAIAQSAVDFDAWRDRALKAESNNADFKAIYDDEKAKRKQAEAELAALKAQRCEACSFCVEDLDSDFDTSCRNGVLGMDYDLDPADFACSRWQARP